MGNKVFSLRNLDMDEVKRLAAECGFRNVAEYVRWCIVNGPKYFVWEREHEGKKNGGQ